MFLVVKIQFWWDCLLTTGGREESLFTSILQKGLGEIVIYIWTFCRSGPEESQCSRSSLLCIFSFDVFVPSVSVTQLKIDLIFPEHHSFFLFGKLFCATVFRVLHSFALQTYFHDVPANKRFTARACMGLALKRGIPVSSISLSNRPHFLSVCHCNYPRKMFWEHEKS